jgi:hypothetical protein
VTATVHGDLQPMVGGMAGCDHTSAARATRTQCRVVIDRAVEHPPQTVVLRVDRHRQFTGKLGLEPVSTELRQLVLLLRAGATGRAAVCVEPILVWLTATFAWLEPDGQRGSAEWRPTPIYLACSTQLRRFAGQGLSVFLEVISVGI